MMGAWVLRVLWCVLTGHRTTEKMIPFKALSRVALCDVCEKCGSIVGVTLDGKKVKI